MAHYDSNLLTRETLLAFLTVMACQAADGLHLIALDVQKLMERGRLRQISL